MAREFSTVEEARRASGVVHIEAGRKVIGYSRDDALPEHCKTRVAAVAREITIQDLDARLRKLEGSDERLR